MDWNEIAQEQYRQPTDRFETDKADEVRALVERLFPAPSEMGARREPDMREVFNAHPAHARDGMPVAGTDGRCPWVRTTLPAVVADW